MSTPTQRAGSSLVVGGRDSRHDMINPPISLRLVWLRVAHKHYDFFLMSVMMATTRAHDSGFVQSIDVFPGLILTVVGKPYVNCMGKSS